MRRETTKSPTDNAATEAGQEEDFLGRWSRRKQRARHESVEAEPPTPVEALEDPGGDPGEAPQERPLTDEDMPPLESLGEDSDYSGFLSPGVSDKLRRVALKKLFSSAYFNVLDGLDDYDDDFRNFEALGDIITADMRHQMEQEAERVKQAIEEEAGEPVEEAQLAAPADDASEEIPADKETAPTETDPGDAQVSDREAGSSSHDAPDSEPKPG